MQHVEQIKESSQLHFEKCKSTFLDLVASKLSVKVFKQQLVKYLKPEKQFFKNVTKSTQASVPRTAPHSSSRLTEAE